MIDILTGVFLALGVLAVSPNVSWLRIIGAVFALSMAVSLATV